MSIAFECEQCGKHYEVGEELAARRARCSSCQTVFRVPQPVDVLDPSTDEESLLAALFEEEFGPAQEETKPCPSCAAALSTIAILCIQCGFHLEKGKKIAIEPEEIGSTKPANHCASPSRNLAIQRRQQHAFTPARYIRGTLVSLIFALVGGGLWAFASLATDYPLGFLAWAVGGLAGLGMALSYEDENGILAGATSAFMALVGCVFSKVLYFSLFLSSFVGALDEYSKEYVAEIVAEDSMRIAGKDPEEVDSMYYDEQVALAMQQVSQWGKEQLKERVTLYEEADRSEAYARLIAQTQQKENDGSPIRADQYTTIVRQVDQLTDAQVVALLDETPAIASQAADAPGTYGLEAETLTPATPSMPSLFGLCLLALLAFGIFGGVFLVLGMISAYRLGSGNLIT